MKQLSFLLLCTVMSAAAMENTSSTQLADGPENALKTQSMPYNISNNWEQDEENVSFPEGESDFSSTSHEDSDYCDESEDDYSFELSSKKRVRLDTNATPLINVFKDIISEHSCIKRCKESLANATRYFLYIQCMGQNILSRLKDNKYSDLISLLSQSGLSKYQLREIYKIIKLPDTKTDGIQEVDGVKFWSFEEFNKLQKKIPGQNCKIGGKEGFEIFQLIYNYLIKNSNKSVEDALDFCKYGYKNGFSYTTIGYNWIYSLTQNKNVPFYILNYLAIVTGKEITKIESRIRNDHIRIKKPTCEMVIKNILDNSHIEACKVSLANATRYFLYIQCMGQNILYHLLKDNKALISLLSQPNLTPDQLKYIYEIIKLPNKKTDGIQEVDGIKFWSFEEFNEEQRKIPGQNCKIEEEEGFKIFQLICNYLIKNSNKSIEDALDFCKYGFKRDFSYTTIDYHWITPLTIRKNVYFYILNYLAIVTGQTVGEIKSRIRNDNITIKKPVSSHVSYTNVIAMPEDAPCSPRTPADPQPAPSNAEQEDYVPSSGGIQELLAFQAYLKKLINTSDNISQMRFSVMSEGKEEEQNTFIDFRRI